jgi:hypothetical protein
VFARDPPDRPVRPTVGVSARELPPLRPLVAHDQDLRELFGAGVKSRCARKEQMLAVGRPDRWVCGPGELADRASISSVDDHDPGRARVEYRREGEKCKLGSVGRPGWDAARVANEPSGNTADLDDVEILGFRLRVSADERDAVSIGCPDGATGRAREEVGEERPDATVGPDHPEAVLRRVGDAPPVRGPRRTAVPAAPGEAKAPGAIGGDDRQTPGRGVRDPLAVRRPCRVIVSPRANRRRLPPSRSKTQRPSLTTSTRRPSGEIVGRTRGAVGIPRTLAGPPPSDSIA